MRYTSSRSNAEARIHDSDEVRARIVIDKLYARAVKGDVAAASLFLDRTIGPVRAAQASPVAASPASPERSGPDAESESRRPRVLLTVAEAAEELRLSPRTIYQLVKTESLGVRRIGRRVLIPTAEIQKILSESVKPS
jgi:excisionase family DNA binding protein